MSTFAAKLTANLEEQVRADQRAQRRADQVTEPAVAGEGKDNTVNQVDEQAIKHQIPTSLLKRLQALPRGAGQRLHPVQPATNKN